MQIPSATSADKEDDNKRQFAGCPCSKPSFRVRAPRFARETQVDGCAEDKKIPLADNDSFEARKFTKGQV